MTAMIKYLREDTCKNHCVANISANKPHQWCRGYCVHFECE